MKQLLFLFFLLIGLSSRATETFILKANSSASVFLSDRNSADQKNAFELLKKYLLEINGTKVGMASLPTKKTTIKIFENTSLHPDGYEIAIDKKTIEISGGSRKGCTYATIHLLEQYLGCSYLSPTYKVIPKQNDISLPLIRLSEVPKNDVRIINLYYGEDQEFRDWHRLNSIEEVYPNGYFVHTFHRLLPWEEYFEKHPEYFALINGQRSIDQLCPSHPEVREIIATKLKAEMQLQPEKQTWSVSQNDNFSYCQCAKCHAIIEAEESPSGPVIDLVNDMAKRFPDKIISTLAYQYSRKAPKSLKPLENVEVMLCTIELMRHKPIETNPESADFKKDIEDWGKICKNIYLWDYTINFNHCISPFPNLHVLQPNIQFFTKNNVNALFEQSNSTTGYEFSELKVHLLSKLMWDPNINVEDEMQRFLRDYYGEAGWHIFYYIEAMEEMVQQQETKLWIYEHPVVHENDLFSERQLALYRKHFNQAEEEVRNDSIYLNHVRLARLPIQYAEMEIATNHMFSDRGWYTLTDGKPVPNDRLFRTLEAFEETCVKNNVPTVNESGLSPKDYISSLKRMIDVNIDGNLAFGKKVTATALPDKKYSSGDLAFLTNGVSDASDYNVHWLGWFGQDTELILDLEQPCTAEQISIGSLWNAKSWILHPVDVSCSVSLDGKKFIPLGSITREGDQKAEQTIKTHSYWITGITYRYVRFRITGTHQLPDWHPSAGQPSWFFVDEIVVK